MEFNIERRKPVHSEHDQEVMEVAYAFSKQVHKELGDIIRAVVLFGSATHKQNPQDIDLLVIVDDIQIEFSDELQQGYRIIIENIVRQVSSRLHITTLRFSNFWEYVRTADPIVVTVLRDGQALIDTGFFAPLQLLLQHGRIRPTKEAIWGYYAKAPQVLLASKWKIMLAVVDLYWSVIDAAHAVLMSVGVIPQTPEHVPGLLREHFSSKGLLDDTAPVVVQKLYTLQKDVYQRRIEYISGARYDKLFEEAESFVKKVRALLE